MKFEIEWKANEGEWEKARDASCQPCIDADRREAEFLVLEELLQGWLFFRAEPTEIEYFHEDDNDWPWVTIHFSNQLKAVSTFLLSGMSFRLIDVALQLPSIMHRLSENHQDSTCFFIRETDGPGEILLQTDEEIQRIYYRGQPGARLTVPTFELIGACERFLRQTVSELDLRAPELLSWNIVRPLLRYRSQSA